MKFFSNLNMKGNRIIDCPDTDMEQKEIAFETAGKRENIKTNEKLPAICGKIARWFTDLGSHLEDRIVHINKSEREKWDKATQVSVSRSLTTGTKVGTITIDSKDYDLYCETNTDTNTDTKNTAGSTDTKSKLFLVGATSQAVNPQTYSHDTAYVGTDGCLYSNNSKTVTTADITQSEAVTAAGQKVLDAREKNAAIEGTLANLIQQANSNLSNMDAELMQKAQSIENNINYQASLTRRYQLEPNKAYLVTVFAYSFDNADATMNTGAFFVYTPYNKGANGAIKEIYNSGHVTLNIDSNCLLSIEGIYQYMHYSITRL